MVALVRTVARRRLADAWLQQLDQLVVLVFRTLRALFRFTRCRVCVRVPMPAVCVLCVEFTVHSALCVCVCDTVCVEECMPGWPFHPSDRIGRIASSNVLFMHSTKPFVHAAYAVVMWIMCCCACIL